MPTKIRLQRKGKKGQPFYHLVVADGRAPRDGRFIERLGTYNPMTHPATITIDFEKTLHWVQVGAQPTDTVRSLLSKQGVMLKHHLLIGVTKGAMTEEQAEEKFQDWLKEKEQKLEQAKKDAQLSEKELSKKKLEEERKINEARAAEIAKKRAKENLKAEEAKAQIEDQAEEPAGAVDNATEAKEEVAEIAEAKTEAKTEEKSEAKTEEKSEEKTEAKTEEKAEEKSEDKTEEKSE